MPVGYSVYRDTPSPVHRRLDPRTKMLWLLALFGVALCFNHPAVLGAVAVALLLVARLAQLRWADLRGFVLLSIWLVVLSVVIWPAYIHGGSVLFTLGPVDVTSSGLLFGLAMGLRISIMVFASAIWMLTTSPQRITAGLLAIGMPYKAGLALSSTIRFIPLMNAERATIMEAQRARGLDLSRGNPIRRAFRAAPILVPLFSRAFLTAQNLTVAMDARGFGARKGRTSIVSLEFSRLDRVLCLVAVAALILSITLRVLGVGVLIEGTL
jgi:energy-coupling factor transport system permease protein